MLDKLIAADRVLAIYFSASHAIACTVAGKLSKIQGELLIHNEGASSITDASSLKVSIEPLLSRPCIFTDPREFANGPFASYFEKEVRFEFGLTFALPGGMLALVELAL
jgi:hypothetical protein